MKKMVMTMGMAVMLLGAGCTTTTVPSALSNRSMLTLPDGKKITVEVARTPDEQAQGLADRSNVGDGMLFCMGETTMQRFWMLGMKVPIDMVWIHGGEVRGVAAEVPLQERAAAARWRLRFDRVTSWSTWCWSFLRLRQRWVELAPWLTDPLMLVNNSMTLHTHFARGAPTR